MTLKLLSGLLLVLFLTLNLGLANSEESMKEVSFETKVSTVETISVSQEVLQRLREVTEKLVRTHLSADYQKSGKVTAEIKILAETEDGYDCESLVTFLYKETFTAVFVRIEFHYIPEQIRDIKIQRF
ncbi:hypothetical protein HQ584_08425 [Patescibacteria group bacterium]|nr:hypothetical protein [Patescibacteria group bacterium]